MAYCAALEEDICRYLYEIVPLIRGDQRAQKAHLGRLRATFWNRGPRLALPDKPYPIIYSQVGLEIRVDSDRIQEQLVLTHQRLLFGVFLLVLLA